MSESMSPRLAPRSAPLRGRSAPLPSPGEMAERLRRERREAERARDASRRSARSRKMAERFA